MVAFTEWRKLPISLAELCINTTLRCGQSFRWRQLGGDDVWHCVLNGRIVSLRQDANSLHFRAGFPCKQKASTTRASPDASGVYQGEDDTESLIKHYFALDVNLTELYRQWSLSDKNFEQKAPQFTGVRILRQDAWEALVSFICSSNNNINRISQMVEKLCLNYGQFIGYIDKRPFHDFPSPAALTGRNVESRLRELGFGYRAKYIYQTAKMIVNDHEEGWLDSLSNPESPPFGMPAASTEDMPSEGREGYRHAHQSLLELQGVGPKVADCVCLMGLGWGEAVPVDTHVWQIAQRDYNIAKGKNKTLNMATYNLVANNFRHIWGKYAGWAQSVMFTADLKTFSEQAKVKKVVAKAEAEEKLPMGNGVISTVKTEVKVEEEAALSNKMMEEPSAVPIVDATEEADAKPVTKKQRRK